MGLSGEFLASFGGEHSEPTGIEALQKRMERNEFDLVAVGRALIVNPDWVRKVESGRFAELSPFHRDALATLM